MAEPGPAGRYGLRAAAAPRRSARGGLCAPSAADRAGIAARLASCGAGRVLPVRQLRAATLRAMVEGKAAGGVVRAADLIEQLSLAPPAQARRCASH
jgi:hypothetical protein